MAFLKVRLGRFERHTTGNANGVRRAVSIIQCAIILRSVAMLALELLMALALAFAIIATITAIAPAHGEWLIKQPDPAVERMRAWLAELERAWKPGVESSQFAERASKGVSYKFDYQPGGVIADHWTIYQFHGRINSQIQVLEHCYSACTLIVATIDKSKLCFGPNAALAFHQARYNITGYLVDDVKTTQWMIDQYPADIQAWINAKGGAAMMPSGNVFWTLNAHELWAMGYRKCD